MLCKKIYWISFFFIQKGKNSFFLFCYTQQQPTIIIYRNGMICKFHPHSTPSPLQWSLIPPSCVNRFHVWFIYVTGEIRFSGLTKNREEKNSMIESFIQNFVIKIFK